LPYLLHAVRSFHSGGSKEQPHSHKGRKKHVGFEESDATIETLKAIGHPVSKQARILVGLFIRGHRERAEGASDVASL
jgi:hypothetical protein